MESFSKHFRRFVCWWPTFCFCSHPQADQTSQPSLNAFCAALDGTERDPQIDYLALQPLVRYWARIREMYQPFESGMLAGGSQLDGSLHLWSLLETTVPANLFAPSD